jgi:hypothetical protein
MYNLGECPEYTVKDSLVLLPRVRTIFQEHLSPPVSYNYLIKQSRGVVIGILIYAI